ncbi:ABC transporter arginine-binding protein 1 precursor [Hartmannibacter diazotrophicus]|uniref:ABC transporter arginine-binding protein 1 n=1 Tax=Hartmannibacter diazotrophicus TaxID=1482074 RepID=A0A2C9D8E2_9HYPH|nr:ABC transporter substrate-binding protein [Hartmannibacter diazotrophicus]SON56449.1 ABC transporter arginine-binding protein 1 precursor [Hartmannibacter diazotrophicus]
MSFFKRIALAAAVVVMAAGAAEAKDWTVVRMGTEGAYPPFNYIDSNGELKGFDIDIGKALCEAMKVKCEWVTQDWDGIIPALQAGKFDTIIASMSITDERMKQIDFSNKYYNSPPAIVTPKDTKMTGATADDMKGAVIGAQTSTTHSQMIEKHFPGAELKLYPTAEELQLDLENGRLDGAIDDVIVIKDWLKTDAGACCKVLSTLTPDPEIYGPGAGIGVRKEDADLKEMLNKAIDQIRADGTYKKINDAYFDFDVYGG